MISMKRHLGSALHAAGRAMFAVGLLLAVGVACHGSNAGTSVPEITVAEAQPPRASARAEQELARRITRAVNDAGLGKGVVGVSVRACDDGPGPGREIVSIRSGKALVPASNLKVVTTGAALHELGGDFEFETRLVRDGDTYVLLGDGDPALGDPAFFDRLRFRDRNGEQRELDEEALLGFWADAIARDLRAEPGGGDGRVALAVDDSIFERDGWHEGWNPNDRLKRYAAEVSGLNFHRNTFHFRPHAVPDARPDWSDMRPKAPWIQKESRNNSRSGGRKDDSSAWISRSPESNRLTFRGVVKGRFAESLAPLELTIHDPAMMVGELLADRLTARGVQTDFQGRYEGPLSADATTVGPVMRSPLGDLVERCNEQSQNLYAESLLKRVVHERLGGPGTWADADTAIKAIARERLGPGSAALLEGVRIDDGSGLSRGNTLTPTFVTAWLDSFADDPQLGELFVDSLSRGGKPDDGTLRGRFAQGYLPPGYRVDGKSGYINGVSCLSGYVTGPDGRRWSFSVLCNGLTGSVRNAKSLQDRVALEIARHGQASS